MRDRPRGALGRIRNPPPPHPLPQTRPTGSPGLAAPAAAHHATIHLSQRVAGGEKGPFLCPAELIPRGGNKRLFVAAAGRDPVPTADGSGTVPRSAPRATEPRRGVAPAVRVPPARLVAHSPGKDSRRRGVTAGAGQRAAGSSRSSSRSGGRLMAGAGSRPPGCRQSVGGRQLRLRPPARGPASGWQRCPASGTDGKARHRGADGTRRVPRR